MPVIVKFANAYITDRLYGGPEEGGWYYDTGSPVMSLPFICDESEETTDVGTVFHRDRHARDVAFETLYRLCEAAGLNPPEYELFKHRDWMVSGFMFCFEDVPAEYYPKERPYYE